MTKLLVMVVRFQFNVISVFFFLFLGDLQAEIDEIDNDIASIRKELQVSDCSDTSLPEETITMSTADRRMLSDSPEF